MKIAIEYIMLENKSMCLSMKCIFTLCTYIDILKNNIIKIKFIDNDYDCIMKVLKFCEIIAFHNIRRRYKML